MKKLFAIGMALTIVAVTSLLASSAEAKNPWNNGVNGRQSNQNKRINRAYRSGGLTRREAARLKAQQAQLARREAAMRRSASGLSYSERARLEHQQDQLSRNIKNQAHDSQHR
ncbi:hypothetical protein BH11CYA1_BH11CYA1_15120 [soil metagenome]